MFLKTLYLDPELHSDIKIKMAKDRIEKKDKIYKTVKDLVVDIWETFLDDEIQIKGYRLVKGKILKTTEMDKTTMIFPDELNKRIDNYLDRFSNSEAKFEDKSFSLITNELLQRVYLDEEL